MDKPKLKEKYKMKFYRIKIDQEKILNLAGKTINHLGVTRYISIQNIKFIILKDQRGFDELIFKASSQYKALRKFVSIFLQACPHHEKKVNGECELIDIDDFINIAGLTATVEEVKSNLYIDDKENFNDAPIRPNYDLISYTTIK